MIRTGRKNGHTIYEMDDVEPGEGDRFIGALGTPEDAADIVQTYNMAEAVLEENRRLREQVDKLSVIAERAEGWRQRLHEYEDRPVLTPEAKADTEAAFQRGVEHAQVNLQTSKYALNRGGIMLVGRAAEALITARRGVEVAEAELTKAVEVLSTDTPPADPEEPTEPKKLYAAVVTPEEVAAQASDEADDGCRCDQPTGVCRIHDVGRA